ncbi:Fumarate and nitrate reduction regulatory protein [Capnocytophaga canimorsus Cc5]|uniref:Fumarate and nitrate reduction regulatory protein n=2 Tax=Capnocytophaga canimorsus TaxID=28188 RepID=F9YU29_CAPCC|nr:Fumarate and nitrate reduction regulatory protein [Capnocytophaga canimorsus Cc5]
MFCFYTMTNIIKNFIFAEEISPIIMQTPKCEQCTNKLNNALKSLSISELGKISMCKSGMTIKKGDVIFEEGETLSGVYCIVEGVCKLSKLCTNGKSQIVRFVVKGDILGQRSVIGKQPANLTAVALTDVQACFIPKEEVLASFVQNTDFSSEVLKEVCEELKRADDTIVDLAQKTVKQRLASALLFLEKTFGNDSNGFINVQLSREEIGNMIGSATESLIRMLSDFNKNNWIITKGKRIRITNPKQLQKIAEGI